jgi:hypothetical protein
MKCPAVGSSGPLSSQRSLPHRQKTENVCIDKDRFEGALLAFICENRSEHTLLRWLVKGRTKKRYKEDRWSSVSFPATVHLALGSTAPIVRLLHMDGFDVGIRSAKRRRLWKHAAEETGLKGDIQSPPASFRQNLKSNSIYRDQYLSLEFVDG